MNALDAVALAKDLFGTRDNTNVWTDAKMLRFLNQAQRTVWRRIGGINQNAVLGMYAYNVSGTGFVPGAAIPLVAHQGNTDVQVLDTIAAVMWVTDNATRIVPLEVAPWRNAIEALSERGDPTHWFVTLQESTLCCGMAPWPERDGAVWVFGQRRLPDINSIDAEEILLLGQLEMCCDLVVAEVLNLMAWSSNERIQAFKAAAEDKWTEAAPVIAIQRATGELLRHGGEWEH